MERAAATSSTSDAPEGGITQMDERCDRGEPGDCGTIAMVLCGDKARTYLFLMDRARQRQVKTAMRKRRFGGQDAACTAGGQQVKPNQGGRQRQRASYGR